MFLAAWTEESIPTSMMKEGLGFSRIEPALDLVLSTVIGPGRFKGAGVSYLAGHSARLKAKKETGVT